MSKATILIVEDDAILAMNLQRMVTLQGHTVAGPLASGEEAVAFLARGKVDLVLMDIVLAGTMNGIAAAEIISQTLNIPIVFLTGFSQDPILEEANVAAPYGYLIKPVSERELAATLEVTLHRHRLDRQLKESQAALEKSEAQYRHLFENSPLGIFRTTIDGHVLAVNAEMARLVGCDTPDEVLVEVTDLAQQFYVDPNQRQELIAQLQRSGIVHHYECETKKKNGDRFWVSITAKVSQMESLASNGQAAVQVIDGFVIDITERKHIEAIQAFLARASTGTSEKPFFKNLAEFLGQSLKTDFVCIDHLEGDGLTARTVAVWCDGHFEDNVTYALKDTPCGKVVENTVCCYTANVCQLFPEDQVLQNLKAESYVGTTLFSHSGRPIGLIAVIGRNPIGNRSLAEATLAMVAPRAAGEIERQQAEAELRDSEVKHRTLLAGLPDVVMRFDQEGRYLFVSENISELVVLPPERFIGKTHKELGVPENLCIFWQSAIQGVFNSGLPFEGESTFKGKRGLVTLNWRLIPELGIQGQVKSVLGLCRDITAHRRAEQNYQTLFREMLDGFALHKIICDQDGNPVDYRFLDVNPAFERMTGLQAEDLVGRTVLEVFPNTEPHWITTYGQVALTGKPFHFENYSVDLQKHFEVSAFQPMPNTFACTFIDITQRRQVENERENLQAQLLQAQKMEAIGTLAGGIAHDFNNILGAIIGYTEIACDAIPPESMAIDYLEKVKDASQRAASLVKQILAFSRQVTTEDVALLPAVIIKEAIKLLRPSLPSTITIKQQIDTSTHAIFADPTNVHQILMNLCTNAYHAMEDHGGTLEITLNDRELSQDDLEYQVGALPGSFVVLTIGDTGMGIPSENRHKIFDPYFTTKEVGKGTGMGLAIVHGIIKRCGGFITCESCYGKGTVFQVYFPALDHVEAHSSSTTKIAPTGKERILFIDDEECLIDLGKRMLERLGYEVTIMNSSLEAWSLFQDQPDHFDVIITDQTMPGITGSDLALKMLQLRPNLPIILCTGYSSIISEKKSESLGIKGFAMKPMVRNEIALLLRKVLDEKTSSTVEAL